MTWQPMETAPKDESDILGYCAVTDGSFYIHEMFYDPESARWLLSDITLDGLEVFPANWMPKPRPPSRSGKRTREEFLREIRYNKINRRLDAADLYHELGSFAAVGRALGISGTRASQLVRATGGYYLEGLKLRAMFAPKPPAPAA